MGLINSNTLNNNSLFLSCSSCNVPATIDKAGADILPSSTENLFKLSVSDSAIVKPFSFYYIKTWFYMLSMVVRSVYKFKVFYPVVMLDSVYMMNMLVSKKFAPNMNGHNVSMFINLFSIHGYHSVSRFIESMFEICLRMANMAAKNPFLVFTNSTLFLEKLCAAKVACTFNIHKQQYNA